MQKLKGLPAGAAHRPRLRRPSTTLIVTRFGTSKEPVLERCLAARPALGVHHKEVVEEQVGQVVHFLHVGAQLRVGQHFLSVFWREELRRQRAFSKSAGLDKRSILLVARKVVASVDVKMPGNVARARQHFFWEPPEHLHELKQHAVVVIAHEWQRPRVQFKEAAPGRPDVDARGGGVPKDDLGGAVEARCELVGFSAGRDFVRQESRAEIADLEAAFVRADDQVVELDVCRLCVRVCCVRGVRGGAAWEGCVHCGAWGLVNNNKSARNETTRRIHK